MASTATRRRVPAGTQILSPNRDDDQCVSLVSGTVKLCKFLDSGRQQIVALASAPTLVDPPFAKCRETGATAVTDTDVCVFRRSVLEAIAGENHALEHRLHMQSLSDLDDAHEHLLTLGRKTARERVAGFLSTSFERRRKSYDSETVGESVDLPLSRTEIADYLGLTVETVSRQFTQLKNDGIIAVPNARRVVLKDQRQLEIAAGL